MPTLLKWYLGLILCFPAFSYIYYLRDNRRDHLLAFLRGKYGSSVAPLLRGYFSSVLSQGMMLLCLPLGLFPNRRPIRQGSPVLLIHGLHHNDSAWLVFAPRLRRQGYRNLHLLSYNTLTRTYPELVVEAAREAERILAANPGKKLMLVGHSLGGLVIRGMLANPDLAPRIGAAVTLGTPYRGSTLADLGMCRLARSLRPQHPMWRDIERLDCPPCPPVLAVYSLVDNMVFPSSSLEPPCPTWRTYICPPISHVALLYHPSVFRRALAFIKAADTEAV